MKKIYTREFLELMEGIYASEAMFRDFFGNKIDALDGIKNNEYAFEVKTASIPIVLSNYNTDPNVGFGTGTANTSRFGPRTEVKYSTEKVNYRAPWGFDVGIDEVTVNEEISEALAATLEQKALVVMDQMNEDYSAFISENAGKSFNVESYTDEAIAALFDEMFRYFVNLKLRTKTLIAKVEPLLYSKIVAHPLSSTLKNSNVNIGANEVLSFKGFLVDILPETAFQAGEIVYAYPMNVAKAFVGLEKVRVIEPEGSLGYAVQGAGKYGEYIPEENKAAVVKVVLGEEETPLTPEQELSAFEALVVNAENSVELDAQTAQAAYNEAMAYKGIMSPEAKVLAGFPVLEQRLIAVYNILYPAAG